MHEKMTDKDKKVDIGNVLGNEMSAVIGTNFTVSIK